MKSCKIVSHKYFKWFQFKPGLKPFETASNGLEWFRFRFQKIWKKPNGLVSGLAKSASNQTKPNFPNTNPSMSNIPRWVMQSLTNYHTSNLNCPERHDSPLLLFFLSFLTISSYITGFNLFQFCSNGAVQGSQLPSSERISPYKWLPNPVNFPQIQWKIWLSEEKVAEGWLILIQASSRVA